MRINWIEYENFTDNVTIERIDFDKINLLVGVSGAGKTTILRVISDYIDIVRKSKSINSASQFTMNFTISKDTVLNTYEWQIKTIKSSLVGNLTEGATGYIVERETLCCNGEDILFRERNKPMQIKGYSSIPQTPLEKSAIAVFQDDDVFKEIKSAFAPVIGLEEHKDAYMYVSKLFFSVLEKTTNEDFVFFESILNLSIMPLVSRLAVAEKFFPEAYKEYRCKVREIFPYVDDIEIEQTEKGQKYFVCLYLENGARVEQDKISSGILKTMNILSYVFFNMNDAIIFFDEIENSLGVNCLDDVMESVVEGVDTHNGQAFLTSHHPYVINTIDSSKWKVVSQEKGYITTKNASEYGIGIGNRDKFFELMNVLNR